MDPKDEERSKLRRQFGLLGLGLLLASLVVSIVGGLSVTDWIREGLVGVGILAVIPMVSYVASLLRRRNRRKGAD